MYAERSKEVFRQEIQALEKVASRIGAEMDKVVELLFASTGKIVVRAFHPVTGVEIATEVAITTGTTAADIARGIKTALHANV